MKKFYTLVVMAIVAMLSMNVSAKQVKVKSNLDNAIYLAFVGGTAWGNLPTEEATIEWAEGTDMVLTPNTGYEIADVVINGTSQNAGKVKQFQLAYADVEEDAVIEVQANSVAMKKFTFVADPKAVSISTNDYSFNGGEYNSVDGQWVVTPGANTRYNINARTGYAIESVTVGDETLPLESSSYHSIYSGTYTTSQTFVISTLSFADYRTTPASFEVKGTPSVLRAYRNGNIEISAEELADFKFSPDYDLPLTLKHYNSQKDLYSVTVNGVKATHTTNSDNQKVWIINDLKEGDQIVVDTDYPEMDVPFKFVFVNDKTDGVVNSVNIDNSSVSKSQWSADDFKVALGSNYNISFNYQDYTIKSIKVNGVAASSIYYISGLVSDPEGVTIEIDATPGEMNTFVFNCLNWEHVTVKANYIDVELTGTTTEIEIPASRTNFQITAKDDYRIVEVLYGETNIGVNFSLNSLTPVDGKYEIDIYAEEMAQIPFELVLSDESIIDIISSIRVNNAEVTKDVWSAEGYTVPVGAPISISFNSQNYTINSIKINGTELQPNYGSYYYNATVPEGDKFTLEIDATKLEAYNVVITCENWEKLSLRAGSALSLTGVTTEFELAPSNYSIYLYPASGYFVKSVTCGDYSSNSSSINLKELKAQEDGKYHIDIVVNEFVRDQQMVVYLEERNWNNSQIILNPNSSLNQSISLQQGYNFINFNESDIPFRLNIYGADYSYSTFVYLNGELITGNYGLYAQNEEVANGSVIKIFQENEPEEHYVSLSVAEDANVNVHADYVTPVSGDFNIHHGSHIVITEKEEAAPAAKPLAEGETAKAVPFKVTVGDQVVAANEKGQVIVPVTEEMSIKVEKEDDPTGVDSIFGTEEVNGAVYNLQGIKVLENASDASRLPAGLYIVNGKKVVLK
ncbi:MAG: hypothetical protein K2H61_01655 [Muribaculaceae bacterium]|nr:hypothetical protein [Muribaculaceae bacterium]